MLHNGDQFGPYKILSKIGQGGTGQVYRAFDTSTNRDVALKVLPPESASNDEFRHRFQREADLVAGIREPHVVPIHKSGEINGQLYLDMRLVDGLDAGTIVREQGALAPARARKIIDQVAAALDSAHAIGLEHRDVKPENMLVTERDFVYLIDFGIARTFGEADLTQTGTAVGTLAYMAPDRFSGASDYRADIYSLACVLYELLTGAPPFPPKAWNSRLQAIFT